jgi:NAD(P)-dependent dehydrogenase (short-subunit alcohol dehydrogenase family)
VIADRQKTILITGASSGIGKACAAHLSGQGHRVFGTSRLAPFPPELAPPGVTTMIQMDVTEDDSVERAVGFVLESTGRIDAVVNNAGISVAGAVEDTMIQEAKFQFETNFFGALRVCRAVLPTMRSQQRGTIVNVSSIAGLIALPYQAMYSASKFALEGLTEALRMEVKPFGIHVVLVEPGDTRTGATDNRRIVAGARQSQAFSNHFEQMMAAVEADERSGISPDIVARLVGRIIDSPSPRLRYRVGSFVQMLAAVLKGILPGRLFEWALMAYYRLR